MIRAIVTIVNEVTGERAQIGHTFTKQELELGVLSPQHLVKTKLKAMVDSITQEVFGK